MTDKKIAVIVAHPDDETLWTGGTILGNRSWDCFVIALCRGSDRDRAPKFLNALNDLYANGRIGDMDDGPEQRPVDENFVIHSIMELLPSRRYDLVISHSPQGEYSRHLRHEETGRAVIRLWQDNLIRTDKLWLFAYGDGNGKHLPGPLANAHIYLELPEQIWLKKYGIITKTYGFGEDSFEALTAPRTEAFWQFSGADEARDFFRILP